MPQKRPHRTRKRDQHWQTAGRMRREGGQWECRKGDQRHQRTGTRGVRLEALLLSGLSAREHDSAEWVGDEGSERRGVKGLALGSEVDKLARNSRRGCCDRN
jgi:hypothetical protein